VNSAQLVDDEAQLAANVAVPSQRYVNEIQGWVLERLFLMDL